MTDACCPYRLFGHEGGLSYGTKLSLVEKLGWGGEGDQDTALQRMLHDMISDGVHPPDRGLHTPSQRGGRTPIAVHVAACP